jgi:hypothetical protein
MNSKMKVLGAVVAMLGMTAVSARAANPSAYLNIDVTITNNVSVSVIGVQSATQTVTWSGQAALQAGSTATVTNDSGYLAERWELTTTANSWDSGTGAAGWLIGATNAADQVKLQAVFGASGIGAASCSGASLFGNNVVAPSLLSSTQTPYTQTILADTIVGAGGTPARPDGATNDRMLAGRERALCWQLTMPTSTSLTGTQVVPVIVTAF